MPFFALLSLTERLITMRIMSQYVSFWWTLVLTYFLTTMTPLERIPMKPLTEASHP